ncbi:hypothetical protein EYF80_034776 [Liparis tanakae]|uniref:Uncharacterized protein n=1 Tax=Liparis tanakae TaxID=230148 RepID=A0A4Z2GNR2_9TELE|nr:hypothetical protein EYF80_034776 [Liparis tanakae]
MARATLATFLSLASAPMLARARPIQYCSVRNLPLVHLVEVQRVEVVQGELAVADLKHPAVEEELALAHRCHGAGPRAGLHQGGRG